MHNNQQSVENEWGSFISDFSFIVSGYKWAFYIVEDCIATHPPSTFLLLPTSMRLSIFITNQFYPLTFTFSFPLSRRVTWMTRKKIFDFDKEHFPTGRCPVLLVAFPWSHGLFFTWKKVLWKISISAVRRIFMKINFMLLEAHKYFYKIPFGNEITCTNGYR